MRWQDPAPEEEKADAVGVLHGTDCPQPLAFAESFLPSLQSRLIIQSVTSRVLAGDLSLNLGSAIYSLVTFYKLSSP